MKKCLSFQAVTYQFTALWALWIWPAQAQQFRRYQYSYFP